MDSRLEDLRSTRNPKARIKIMKGHFATSNSHLNTYIDMSTVKTRHNNAKETAKELANAYMTNATIDTIVCLDETEVYRNIYGRASCEFEPDVSECGE